MRFAPTYTAVFVLCQPCGAKPPLDSASAHTWMSTRCCGSISPASFSGMQKKALSNRSKSRTNEPCREYFSFSGSRRRLMMPDEVARSTSQRSSGTCIDKGGAGKGG